MIGASTVLSVPVRSRFLPLLAGGRLLPHVKGGVETDGLSFRQRKQWPVAGGIRHIRGADR